MSNYVILNSNTNNLEFFNDIHSLVDYFGIDKFIPNTEYLLEKGLFLLKITVQSFDKAKPTNNPDDSFLVLTEHEYLIPLPLFLNQSEFELTRNTLSIWNCILQQYSELLNKYSEDELGITPFDINYSIYHSISLHADSFNHDRTVNSLKSILAAYKQEYLTNDS